MMAAINKSGNRKLIIILIGLHTTFTACCRPTNLKTFPAEPHYKFTFIIGEASSKQAGSKPRVVGSALKEFIFFICMAAKFTRFRFGAVKQEFIVFDFAPFNGQSINQPEYSF